MTTHDHLQNSNRHQADSVNNRIMRPTTERTFVCPDMDSQVAAQLIQHEMDNTPGVLECEVSLADRTVRVLLGDMEGEATVRRHLMAAGYAPED